MGQKISTLEGFLPKNAILMGQKKRPKKAPKKSTYPSKTPSPELLATLPKDPSQLMVHLKTELSKCSLCQLCECRNQVVIGGGSPKAKVVFIGEAPGEQEDESGIPFVGRAGQLLDKMIGAIGLSRDSIYICNVVKCRPPENRNPETEEIEACSPFLFAQLDAIQPTLIVTLGKFSSQTLLKTETPISELRGKFFEFRGAKLLPTFHPAYLLRNPSAKREAWEDLKLVAKELDLPLPQG